MCAKVFGPALSIDAKGKVGRGVAFQSRPRGTALIKNPRPGQSYLDNPTAAQKTQRDAIAALINQWQALNTNKRGYWDAAAKELGNNLAGYHEFMKAKGVATMPLSRLLDYWPDLKRGLVGYWAFDKEGENAAKDYSGEGNDGILKPTYPADCPTQVGSKNQVLDKALDFDGVNEFVDCGNPVSLQLTNDFSISFWMKLDSTESGVYAPISHGHESGAGNNGWTFQASDTPLYFTYGNGTTYKTVNVVGDLRDDTWHHIVIIKSSTAGTKIYLDGVFNAENVSGTDAISLTGQNLSIGKDTGYGRYADCLMDEVRIYNRILSISELKQLYNISM